MKIYLTRHGETDWNQKGLMQGWQNSDLSEKGIENTKKLSESLKHISFDTIYCSPLGRAIETVKLLKGDRDTSIVVKEALKEMGFGIWEGKEHRHVKENYTEQHKNFWELPHIY